MRRKLSSLQFENSLPPRKKLKINKFSSSWRFPFQILKAWRLATNSLNTSGNGATGPNSDKPIIRRTLLEGTGTQDPSSSVLTSLNRYSCSPIRPNFIFRGTIHGCGFVAGEESESTRTQASNN